GHLMTEPMTIMLGLATVLIGMRFLAHPTAWATVLLGAIAAAGHLTRSQAMLPGMALWLVALFTLPWRRWFQLGAGFAVVYVALVASWLVCFFQYLVTVFFKEVMFGIKL